MKVNSDTADAWMEIVSGTRRRILSQGKDLMMVEFDFLKGGEGPLHSHPHVQTTFVASGRFEFTVSGVTKTLEKNDSIFIPSGAEHSCVCLEKGNLIDSFAPRRDDFMEAHGIPLD